MFWENIPDFLRDHRDRVKYLYMKCGSILCRNPYPSQWYDEENDTKIAITLLPFIGVPPITIETSGQPKTYMWSLV